jgi:hypothetical protein
MSPMAAIGGRHVASFTCFCIHRSARAHLQGKGTQLHHLPGDKLHQLVQQSSGAYMTGTLSWTLAADV